MNNKVKFIFITGGVVSSLGKGLATASYGLILKSMGFNIKFVKCDPYLNVDPGTMNPNQHGEVFVTIDGAETDLDLGHYERFTGMQMTKNSSITSGKVYTSILEQERRGVFLGKTVQTIPHVINEIKTAIYKNINEDTDFILCEIGGTVGDMEALPFLEAIRQIGHEYGHHRVLYTHMTLVPYLSAAKELKTKPTQHSVRELRSLGIQPDILLCRAEHPIPKESRAKIASFCNMHEHRVIEALDNSNVYEIPLDLCSYNLDVTLCQHFKITYPENDYLHEWKTMLDDMKHLMASVKIAIIGKYTSLEDSYKSLYEALKHAGIKNKCKVELVLVDAHNINEENVNDILSKFTGIIVPGGFGSGGIEGKIEAIKYARMNKIPFFGICLGMQLAVIEAARNLLNIKDATSTEFEKDTANPLILHMNEWIKSCGTKELRENNGNLGGTMRLGGYVCKLEHGSLAYQAYGQDLITERHRHRYEVNNNYKAALEGEGVKFSGLSEIGDLIEIMELPEHPWFLAVQFHPELQSGVLTSHPLFDSFVGAALKSN